MRIKRVRNRRFEGGTFQPSAFARTARKRSLRKADRPERIPPGARMTIRPLGSKGRAPRVRHWIPHGKAPEWLQRIPDGAFGMNGARGQWFLLWETVEPLNATKRQFETRDVERVREHLL